MVNGNRILVALGIFLALGFFFLSSSETSFAGTPGCCITNGGQCSPSCGPEGTSCANDGEGPNPFAQCPTNVPFSDAEDCGSGDFGGILQKCHVLGAVCFQVTNSDGICMQAPPPTPTPTPSPTPGGPTPTPTPPILGCCGLLPDSPLTCEDPVEIEACALDGGTFNEFGSCQPDFSCEFTPRVIPTMNEWGGIITAGFLGLIAIFFITRRFVVRRSS